MKFDYAIGNPPYQADVEDSDNKTFKPPIYNQFMDAAYSVAEKVELIHPARFLFNAGQTPKAWNEKMLSDPHFKVMRYEPDGSKVFPNTEIKGGVAVTYHDEGKQFGAIEVFTPYPELNDIMKKVGPKNDNERLTSIMFNQTRFDLTALYQDHPQFKKIIGSDGRDKRFRNNIFEKVDLFVDKKGKNDIEVLGVVKNKRQWKYFPIKYVDREHENLNKWKVLIVRVNGVGCLGETLSTPIVASPNQGYTQTFIGIGAFDTKAEAESALKYIKTKLARAMLGILKITQDNSIETWKYVPLQDFTDKSDIDWNQSIANIDRQLYKKYGLSQEEIDFIETHVKEMT